MGIHLKQEENVMFLLLCYEKTFSTACFEMSGLNNIFQVQAQSVVLSKSLIRSLVESPSAVLKLKMANILMSEETVSVMSLV